MLCIKVATIGTEKYPTIVRLSLCRFNIENDKNVTFDELRKRSLNLKISPQNQSGDKTRSYWDNKSQYTKFSVLTVDENDIDYRNIPKYISAYCKKFNIDMRTVLVWDDCNKTRDVLDKIGINPFNRTQWLDINTALIALTCGETVAKNMHEIPSSDVVVEILGLLKLIHTGSYYTYNPDDDLPF